MHEEPLLCLHAPLERGGVLRRVDGLAAVLAADHRLRQPELVDRRLSVAAERCVNRGAPSAPKR